MSILMRELLGSGTKLQDLDFSIQSNLQDLLSKINKVRDKWGLPMTVTSGFRSLQKHLQIYAEINEKRKKQKLPPKTVPMGSRHLSGQQVDISDPDGSLHDWCVKNTKLLEEIGLWCEVKDEQKRVHFQTVAPKSGKRFFNP